MHPTVTVCPTKQGIRIQLLHEADRKQGAQQNLPDTVTEWGTPPCIDRILHAYNFSQTRPTDQHL